MKGEHAFIFGIVNFLWAVGIIESLYKHGLTFDPCMIAIVVILVDFSIINNLFFDFDAFMDNGGFGEKRNDGN